MADPLLNGAYDGESQMSMKDNKPSNVYKLVEMGYQINKKDASKIAYELGLWKITLNEARFFYHLQREMKKYIGEPGKAKYNDEYNPEGYAKLERIRLEDLIKLGEKKGVNMYINKMWSDHINIWLATFQLVNQASEVIIEDWKRLGIMDLEFGSALPLISKYSKFVAHFSKVLGKRYRYPREFFTSLGVIIGYIPYAEQFGISIFEEAESYLLPQEKIFHENPAYIEGVKQSMELIVKSTFDAMIPDTDVWEYQDVIDTIVSDRDIISTSGSATGFKRGDGLRFTKGAIPQSIPKSDLLKKFEGIEKNLNYIKMISDIKNYKEARVAAKKIKEVSVKANIVFKNDEKGRRAPRSIASVEATSYYIWLMIDRLQGGKFSDFNGRYGLAESHIMLKRCLARGDTYKTGEYGFPLDYPSWDSNILVEFIEYFFFLSYTYWMKRNYKTIGLLYCILFVMVVNTVVKIRDNVRVEHWFDLIYAMLSGAAWTTIVNGVINQSQYDWLILATQVNNVSRNAVAGDDSDGYSKFRGEAMMVYDKAVEVGWNISPADFECSDFSVFLRVTYYKDQIRGDLNRAITPMIQYSPTNTQLRIWNRITTEAIESKNQLIRRGSSESMADELMRLALTNRSARVPINNERALVSSSLGGLSLGKEVTWKRIIPKYNFVVESTVVATSWTRELAIEMLSSYDLELEPDLLAQSLAEASEEGVKDYEKIKVMRELIDSYNTEWLNTSRIVNIKEVTLPNIDFPFWGSDGLKLLSTSYATDVTLRLDPKLVQILRASRLTARERSDIYRQRYSWWITIKNLQPIRVLESLLTSEFGSFPNTTFGVWSEMEGCLSNYSKYVLYNYAVGRGKRISEDQWMVVSGYVSSSVRKMAAAQWPNYVQV